LADHPVAEYHRLPDRDGLEAYRVEVVLRRRQVGQVGQRLPVGRVDRRRPALDAYRDAELHHHLVPVVLSDVEFHLRLDQVVLEVLMQCRRHPGVYQVEYQGELTVGFARNRLRHHRQRSLRRRPQSRHPYQDDTIRHLPRREDQESFPNHPPMDDRRAAYRRQGACRRPPSCRLQAVCHLVVFHPDVCHQVECRRVYSQCCHLPAALQVAHRHPLNCRHQVEHPILVDHQASASFHNSVDRHRRVVCLVAHHPLSCLRMAGPLKVVTWTVVT
jgi:hypothetical protein